MQEIIEKEKQDKDVTGQMNGIMDVACQKMNTIQQKVKCYKV